MQVQGALRVREMRWEDIPCAQRILWDTWKATYAGFIPERDLRSYFDGHYSVGDFELMLGNPDVETFLAELDGEPAGFARTQLSRHEKRLYLGSLYVLPAFQGKGAGAALLRRAEQCALRHSMNEIWLGVMVQNTGAVAWYERMGFMFVKEEPFIMGETSVPHRIGYRPIPL